MSTIKINGVTIVSANGGSISVSNGRVVVDGQDVTPDEKQISIEVQGNVDRLDVDACERIIVAGTVGALSTRSGDVECGTVSGGIHTMSGSVTCNGDITGSVQTMSGDVRASGRIAGGANSMSGRIRSI